MKLLFRCGHVGAFKDGQEPCCACGERGIARVLGAPPPRIVGMATGPLVQTQDMEAATPVIGDTPLKLRQETTDA